MSDLAWTSVSLWLAVVASGLYHGINPGMGWPLAVSASLADHHPRGLFHALWPLAVGHLAAMLAVMLPFAVLVSLYEWRESIQITAGVLVVLFGIFRLIHRRHPRSLARIPPTQLALWSFAVAIAHGAGLMLLPIFLGLCSIPEGHHEAAHALAAENVGTAVRVALLHTAAMIGAGGLLAWLVYRYLGLKFISRSWFNLETAWACTLIAVGLVALALPS